MGRQINYDKAKELIETEFDKAFKAKEANKEILVPKEIKDSANFLFKSRTQAFREALIGCALARILDSEIEIHLPYMNQGENAFSGRMLDERVVNPFFNKHKIPCSKSPYLSALRRNVSLVPETEKGIKDKRAYSSLLVFVSILAKSNKREAKKFLRFLLYNFLLLQEASEILVSKINRLSLLQHR